MLNSFRLLLAAACTFLSSPATRAAPPEDWNTYRNERFGFSLLYPADVFAPDRTAQAGDGELMVSRDGSARLLIGGLINDDHRSPAAYQDYIARKSYASRERLPGLTSWTPAAWGCPAVGLRPWLGRP